MLTKVLIVDDETIVRIGIRSMIDWEKNGFEIVGEAGDGEKALEMIRALSPHIVLTDIKMLPMDGLELIQQIRDERLPVRTIVLSCHNEFEYVKQALKLGASDYILKLSMQPHDLLETMKAVSMEVCQSSEPADKPVQNNDWLNGVRRHLQSTPEITPGTESKEADDYKYILFTTRIYSKLVVNVEPNDFSGLMNAALIFINDTLSDLFDVRSFSFVSAEVQ